MSLNKSISKGTEHRKQYRVCKVFDRTCRNHGSYDWCCDNRLHKNLKKILSANDKSTLNYYGAFNMPKIPPKMPHNRF